MMTNIFRNLLSEERILKKGQMRFKYGSLVSADLPCNHIPATFKLNTYILK